MTVISRITQSGIAIDDIALVVVGHDPILGNVAELIWNEVNDEMDVGDDLVMVFTQLKVSLGTYSNAPINTAINNIARLAHFSRDEVFTFTKFPFTIDRTFCDKDFKKLSFLMHFTVIVKNIGRR